MRSCLAKMRLHVRRRSEKGETLVEALAAVLVAAFAALMLVSSTVVAGNLNVAARQKDDNMAADQVAVELRDTTAATASAAQAQLVDDDGTVLGTYDITVYTGNNELCSSYAKAGE